MTEKNRKNPVKQVVVTIDINRYQTVNNDGKTAKSPDYGTWYDQTDSSTQECSRLPDVSTVWTRQLPKHTQM